MYVGIKWKDHNTCYGVFESQGTNKNKTYFATIKGGDCSCGSLYEVIIKKNDVCIFDSNKTSVVATNIVSAKELCEHIMDSYEASLYDSDTTPYYDISLDNPYPDEWLEVSK